MKARTGSEQVTATVAVACLATAMLMLDISVINTALSKIAHDLSSGLSGLQWVVDGYTLPLAAGVLTAGSLSDRIGRRRMFVLGLVLFTGASATCGLSQSIGLLDGARVAQGVGAAMLFGTSLALIAHVTPTHDARQRALAIYGTAIGAAFAIGPFVGGALADLISWRAIFLINIPLGVIALTLTLLRVEEFKNLRPRPLDWPGQLTLVLGLSGLVLGLLRSDQDGWSSTLVLTSLLVGGGMLVAFVVIELVRPDPMLPLRYFRLPGFAGAQISMFAVSASQFALFFYLSLYLQGPLGRSPLGTGVAYLPGCALMFVASGATPAIAARIGNGAVTTIGVALVTVGNLLLLLGGATSSWTILLPGTIVGFVGTGFFNPAVSAFAMGSLPAHEGGVASGAFDTFRQAGIALGTAALGALVPANALRGAAAGTFVTGLHHAELVAAGISAMGTVVAACLLLSRPRRATIEEVSQPFEPLGPEVETVTSWN